MKFLLFGFFLISIIPYAALGANPKNCAQIEVSFSDTSMLSHVLINAKPLNYLRVCGKFDVEWSNVYGNGDGTGTVEIKIDGKTIFLEPLEVARWDERFGRKTYDLSTKQWFVDELPYEDCLGHRFTTAEARAYNAETKRSIDSTKPQPYPYIFPTTRLARDWYCNKQFNWIPDPLI